MGTPVAGLPPSNVFRYWTADPLPLARVAECIQQLAAAATVPVPADRIPSAADLERMVEAAYWASLSPDEGRFPVFSVVYTPPQSGVMRVSARPLTGRNVAAMASALSKTAAHLGVTRADSGELWIWGIFPGSTTSVCVRAIAPARVIVSIGHDNLAVVHRGEITLLVETDPAVGLQHGAGRAHCARLLGQAFASNHVVSEWVIMGALLLMVGEAARAHRHGGTLLIAPHARHEAIRWLDLGPNRTLYAGLRHLLGMLLSTPPMATDPLEVLMSMPALHHYMMGRRDLVPPDILRVTEAIGTLSAIDGAVVFSQSLRVRAFGAMVREPAGLLSRRDEIDRVSILNVAAVERVNIRELGGARRRSAATFVANNYDCVALTASQDGGVSLASWVGDQASGRPVIITDLEYLLD